MTDRQVKRLRRKCPHINDYFFDKIITECSIRGFSYGCAKRKLKTTEVVSIYEFTKLVNNPPAWVKKSPFESIQAEIKAAWQPLETVEKKAFETKANELWESAVAIKQYKRYITLCDVHKPMTVDELCDLNDEVLAFEKALCDLIKTDALKVYPNIFSLYVDEKNSLVAITRSVVK